MDTQLHTKFFKSKDVKDVAWAVPVQATAPSIYSVATRRAALQRAALLRSLPGVRAVQLLPRAVLRDQQNDKPVRQVSAAREYPVSTPSAR
jgi:hypothetical protein